MRNAWRRHADSKLSVAMLQPRLGFHVGWIYQTPEFFGGKRERWGPCCRHRWSCVRRKPWGWSSLTHPEPLGNLKVLGAGRDRGQ